MIGACWAFCRVDLYPTWSYTFLTFIPKMNASVFIASAVTKTCIWKIPPTNYNFFISNIVPIRLAFWFVANSVSNIAGAFIATGILRLRGLGGRSGWRYLFLIEGCITLVVGFCSFIFMPPGPTQTKAWFRPKGWFTERWVTYYWYPFLLPTFNSYAWIVRKRSWSIGMCLFYFIFIIRHITRNIHVTI